MAVCIRSFPSNREITADESERRLWDATAFLRLWHLASLDAPTVAVVWSYAFAWAARVRLPAWAPTVLALIVWAVYVGDRLLDARAGMQSPPLHRLRERHFFHWRFRWILAPAGLIAAVAAACLVITKLPAGARMPDSAVAAATLAYFSGVHSRGRVRSLVERMVSPLAARAVLIGVLFTAGCLLPAASQVSPGALLSVGRVAVAGYFAALAWLNCYTIGIWESRHSKRTATSVLRRAGAVAMMGAALAISLAPGAGRPACLLACGAFSALLFVVLQRMRTRLAPVVLRAGADLVLLTPVLLLLMGR